MADESVSIKKATLGKNGLAKLVSLVLKALGEGSGGDESKGDYLPLTGGTITGDLTVNAGESGVTINAPKENADAKVLTVNGQTHFGDEIYVSSCATIASDLSVNGLLEAKSELRVEKYKATFCGGTYIDTEGHIHLPSGVEIY